MSTEPTEATPTLSSEELCNRLFMSGLAAFDLLTLYIGDRLGLYKTLAGGGAMRPPRWQTWVAGLAGRASLSPRLTPRSWSTDWTTRSTRCSWRASMPTRREWPAA